MKYTHIFATLFLYCSLGLQAQTSEEVVKDVVRFTNPEWFQSLAQPGKKNYKPQVVDSVLIEYANKVDRRKILIQTVQYTGEFKNGLFHGRGKLLIKMYGYPYQNDKPGTFTYEGDFMNGAATGKGFLNYSWWYKPLEMNAVLVKMNCQADFQDGVLKNGLIRYDHVLNGEPVLTCFYNGELCLKNWTPVLHGLGIVYISKNSPGSEMAKRSPGIDGGLYAGNFFYGEYTGFAICNYLNAPAGELSNLLVGITGKGELLHTFSMLPVNKDWSYREPLPSQTQPASFPKLFGDFRDVKRGVIYLDTLNKYTGGIKNDLPHGIGYIENGNGFYDIAFWNAGKRLSVKEVLGGLLGDTSMLEMKRLEKKVTETYTSNKGTRQELHIQPADYYGKLNQNGHPEGWGIFLRKKDLDPAYIKSYDSTSYEMNGTVIGNFTGADLPDHFDDAEMLRLIRDEDKKNSFVVGIRENDVNRSYAFVSANINIVNSIRRVNEYYSTATPTIGAIETESFKDDMDEYMRSKFEILNYLSGRKSIGVKQVNLSDISGNSYVETFTGEKIYLQELTADQVRYGDFILYNDVFYEVNRVLLLNDYVAPNAVNPHLSVAEAFKKQKCYVLKGYWLAASYETDPDMVCAFCGGKAPGKTTYTGVGYTGRYETNVYENNSGGINIVSKPITTITAVTVENKPCKYCKGYEVKRRVKANIVRK